MDTNFLAEIHTRVVHFPLALLTTYALLEIFGIIFNKDFISKSALLILCLGVVVAVFAVLTGNQASAEFTSWNDESKALLAQHQSYATYLLWSSVVICALRIFVTVKKKFEGSVKFIFIPLAVVILILVYETGICGGDLVKKFGIGTDLLETSNEKQNLQ